MVFAVVGKIASVVWSILSGQEAKKFNNPDDAYSWIEDELAIRAADKFYIMVEPDELFKRKLIFFSKQRLSWEY